jgi:hypothetical protein
MLTQSLARAIDLHLLMTHEMHVGRRENVVLVLGLDVVEREHEERKELLQNARRILRLLEKIAVAVSERVHETGVFVVLLPHQHQAAILFRSVAAFGVRRVTLA